MGRTPEKVISIYEDWQAKAIEHALNEAGLHIEGERDSFLDADDPTMGQKTAEMAIAYTGYDPREEPEDGWE